VLRTRSETGCWLFDNSVVTLTAVSARAASLKREALTHTPGGRSENSAASAAASLKRRLVEEDRTTARRKFRGICRGLIEATSKRAPPTAGLLKIPRHLPRPH